MTPRAPAPTRRAFLGTAGVLAGTAAAGVPAARAADPAPDIRFGHCVNGLAGWKPTVDIAAAIETVGPLGFDGVEMVCTSTQDLTGYWAGAGGDAVRAALDRHKLAVARFGLFFPTVGPLGSANPDDRKRALDHVEAGCKLAVKFGAAGIGFVPPRVPGFSRVSFDTLYTLPAGKKMTAGLPPGFDWKKAWAGFVDTTRECLARAKAYGLTLALEPHPDMFVMHSAQFERLAEEIPDPALGLTLDTCWTLMQCEHPVFIAHRLKGRVNNVQFRDLAPERNTFARFGDGMVDFPGVLKALRDTGYRGWVSLEEVFLGTGVTPQPRGVLIEDAKRFVAFMRQQLGRA
jgi:sugar phosphate isomerase/epimerase